MVSVWEKGGDQKEYRHSGAEKDGCSVAVSYTHLQSGHSTEHKRCADCGHVSVIWTVTAVMNFLNPRQLGNDRTQVLGYNKA